MKTRAVHDEKFSAFLNKVANISEFPPNSRIPSAEALRALLDGRAFAMATASTGTFYTEFFENGSLSVVTSGGYRSGGQWSCEHGILCTTRPDLGRVWSPVRVVGEADIYLKRHTGEVVRYTPL